MGHARLSTHLALEGKTSWYAEDVGKAIPRNTKVGPTITLNVEDPDARGSFSRSKPTTDWPVGSYRMELSVNGKLVETLNFTVVEAAAD